MADVTTSVQLPDGVSIIEMGNDAQRRGIVTANDRIVIQSSGVTKLACPNVTKHVLS